jgi:polyhydroxybutyrate depolymerase
MRRRGALQPYGRGGQELGHLERRELSVDGVRRGYWLARVDSALPADRRGPPGTAPLLIVLHGSGMTGRAMARFTGLAARGPAAGMTVAFPDGWKGVWHTIRPPDDERNLDDVLFLSTICAQLESIGAARSWPVFLAGVSDGARFAEHVARHGLLPVTGLFLASGTTLTGSRRAAPVPLVRSTVICVQGTADPFFRYEGGPLIRRGLSGAILRRRMARHGELPGESVVVGVEQTCADWVAGNGITTAPTVADLPPTPGDPTVTRKTWSAPGCRPVTLYRVDGGGHGWPGGPQFLPTRSIGTVARHLDATDILLSMAGREIAAATGRRFLERGRPGAPPW